ncbi:VanW family protein [Candidatus Uhrbacteria bacterium]|nr:VanW family protein [Candidatus Uhrbacteria bacterium]
MIDQKKRDILLTTLVICGLVIGLSISMAAGLAAAAYGYDNAFRGRIFPGVRVAGVRLDGLTPEAARQRIEQSVDEALDPGFVFRFKDKEFSLPRATVSLEDPDASQDLVRYDADPAIMKAFQAGRGGSFLTDAITRMRMYVQTENIPLTAETNKPLVKRLLLAELENDLLPAKDAELIVSIPTSTASSTLMIKTEPERLGTMADLDPAVDALSAQAARLTFQPIRIQTSEIVPKVLARDISPLEPFIPEFLQHAPFTLMLENKPFKVTSSTLAGWIGVSSTQEGMKLAIDPTKLVDTLKPLAATVVREAKDGRIEVDENNKLTLFEAPIEGVSIDTDATIQELEKSWLSGSTTIPVKFAKVEPKILGDDAERLGIHTRLGIGESDFSGSPTNRRKNMALGVKKMNGVLIAPGEEFSQLKALGPITGANGWLPELVIKGNETTPEFGGGLCQVGTTSFRMALKAGLQITQRRNHSYRVRYYEPAGTDATIYEPAPDFRFKNDTNGWILITAESRNDKLYFTAWGTDDGRKAEQTYPRIYNIVAPPPTKYIPTTDLPIGKKRCTESAHAGATASFDYTVTYANGEEKKETFTSYYRPWGAVCLVGATPEEVAASQSTVDETGINNPN